MKVMITGGSGFFGQYLLRKFQQTGSDLINFDLVESVGPIKCQFIQGDILDSSCLSSALKGVDLVVHSLALVPLAKDIDQFWEINRRGTAQLLEACTQNEVRKVIYLSSSAVYGIPQNNPVTEQTVPRPIEDYGLSKYAGEKLCQAYSKEMDITIIRPRTILGPGRLGIFQILFEWIYHGQKIPILGDGQNRYQFVHAEDLAEACLLASQKMQGWQEYNIGADQFTTMQGDIQALIQHAGTTAKIRRVPKALGIPALKWASALGLSPMGPYHWSMYGENFFFETQLAQKFLHWRPRFSNAESLIESYDWYCAHREEILVSRSGRSLHRSGLRQGALHLFKYCP